MPVKVYYINVKYISESNMRSYYSNLSKVRKEKVDRFKFSEDKRLSIMAEILLKYALEKERIAFPKKILESEYGKPYIDGIYFNISHSKEYVVVAISKEEVGCDIENISEINLDIAKRYFSDVEYRNVIDSEDEEEKKKLFFRYWTLKESFLKLVGCGLKKPLNSFNIKIGKKITVNQNEIKDNFYFTEYKKLKRYALSVCSKERNVDFYRINIKDIRLGIDKK